MGIASAPDVTLRLEAAHGCRANDIRGNLHYNYQEGILYPVAALVVIYNPRTGQQLFHHGHVGDVISLTVSSCGRFAASGEAAIGSYTDSGAGKNAKSGSNMGSEGGRVMEYQMASVRIWDAATGTLLSRLVKAHHRGVALLCFSADGRWLASMGHDAQHTIAVYT
ncbi:unnamed protein product [Choristocarpus tenellus]